MRYYGNVTRYYEKFLFFCCELNRLFTVFYFSVRSSRSSSLRYGLPSSMSVKTTNKGAGVVWEESPFPYSYNPRPPPLMVHLKIKLADIDGTTVRRAISRRSRKKKIGECEMSMNLRVL